jgi:outer membrane receptor protein involved in Fe transport
MFYHGHGVRNSVSRTGNRLLRVGVSGFCCIGALAGATAARAQEAAGGSVVLPDIVVTAEKRSSSVQNVPISVTAITGAQLRAAGLTDLADIVRNVPGVSMRTNGPGQTELEIRGLASSGGSAPTVGYYIDETPLSPPAAAGNGKVVLDPDLYDLDRVEVLRGPQGTLYGSGSMGGTVKLITRMPNTKTFEGSVSGSLSATQGGGANGGANVMLNVPVLRDKVALRVVATSRYTSGWIDRIVAGEGFPLVFDPDIGELNIPVCPGSVICERGDVRNATVEKRYEDVNHNKLTNVRASLLLLPAENMSVAVTGMYQKMSGGGYNTYDKNPGTLAHYQPDDLKEPFSDEFKMASAVVKYWTDTVELTSATSYFSKQQDQSFDTTEQFQRYFNLTFFPTNANIETDKSHQFSQELRVASQGGGRFQWVVGAFFADMTSRFIVVEEAPSAAFLSVGGAEANPRGILYNVDNPYNIKQYAAFGEASFKFTDALKGTVGLRYFKYNSRAAYNQAGIGATSGNAEYTRSRVSSKSDGFNPRFNLSYIPSRDLTLYATASKGFRPGGQNEPAPQDLCGQQPRSYGPDTVWNYEVGEKLRLFGGRLSINSDFYYIRWKGVQQYLIPNCSYGYTSNAGDAKSYGPEVEILARLGQHWTISASGTKTVARLTSVQPESGFSPGDPILNIPEYTGSFFIEYRTPFGDGMEFTGRVADQLVGPTYDVNYYVERLPAYNLVDVRLSVAKNGVTATLFATNLTNERAQLGINNSLGAWPVAALTRVTTNQPRTIGVDLSYLF